MNCKTSGQQQLRDETPETATRNLLKHLSKQTRKPEGTNIYTIKMTSRKITRFYDKDTMTKFMLFVLPPPLIAIIIFFTFVINFTKFQMWIRFGTGTTQPREDNWVAT